MSSTTLAQGVYLNVPRADWNLFQELVRKFGWEAESREEMLDKFLRTRPDASDLTETDIMNEVKAVRYKK
ncbi:MAG: hypothetical protein IKO46_10035 [Salinivirgaceae bacterium]|nr:hypothetical protein [Salinivirgaceae bacterium]